jgi:hypothetical protein
MPATAVAVRELERCARVDVMRAVRRGRASHRKYLWLWGAMMGFPK